MAAIIIRNIPDAVHHALKARASSKGRSTEAEMRAILEEAVLPADRVRIGSELVELGREFGGIELQLPSRTEFPKAADLE